MAKEERARRLSGPVLWGLTAILSFASCVYLSRGFYALTLSDKNNPEWGPAIDLHLRWLEYHYILRGKNPFDNYFRDQPEGPVHPPRPIHRNSTQEPDLGGVIRASYPPWAYVTGSVLWSLPVPAAVRWWNAVLNVMGLAFIASWAFQMGRRIGLAEGSFLAASTLACAHYFTILLLGQISIFVVALLMATLMLAETGRHRLSGLALALAMLKPTIAGPFFLIFLVRRRLPSVIACLVYLSLASGLVWVLTSTSPLEMLQQMQAIAEQVEVGKGTPGTITWLIDLGISPSSATKAAIGLVLLPCAGLLWLLRDRPMVDLFAIASVAAQLWTHHKVYDEVVLLLLTVPLMAYALAHCDHWLLLVLAFMNVLSILHLRLLSLIPIAFLVPLQMMVWLFGLMVFLMRGARDRELTSRELTRVSSP